MTDTETPGTGPETTEQPKPRSRGGRRRGGRGRRPKSDPAATEPASVPSESAEEVATTPPVSEDSPAVKASPSESKPKKQGIRRTGRGRKPRESGAPDLQTVKRQVQGIVDSLQQALEEMEAAQQLLEQVERERGEDLQELESLRRLVDRLQSGRSGSRSPSSWHAG